MAKKKFIWRKSTKRIIAICILALLGFAIFAFRDIFMYYLSGIGYVKANYTAATVEIPCDIEFTVDLTLLNGMSQTRQQKSMEYPDIEGLTYRSFGKSTYILDDAVQMAHDFDPEEGNNYNIQFYWRYNTNNPLSHIVIMPFDVLQYENDLQSTKTTFDFGGGPNYSVPADNITVVAGNTTYTPVWYEAYTTGGVENGTDANYYVQFYQLGLFDDPTLLDELLAQGITTATVKINTLYKTTYTAPGIDKLFASRKKAGLDNLQPIIGEEQDNSEFECGFNVGYPIMDDSDEFSMVVVGHRDFLIGEEWSVIPGRRVIECRRNGAIKNISGPDVMTIVKIEPIVYDNIGGEWEWYMTPLYRNADGILITGFSPEITQAELNFKLPFTWNKNETNYLQFRIALVQQDVASYGVAEEDIEIKVYGMRFYTDDGTIYEFYNDDQYKIIEAENE